MKIIQIHNYYQQAGGEDSVVAAERDMLEAAGHEVIPYYKDNDGIVGDWQLIVTSLKTLWNFKTYRELCHLLKNARPDVVHCHNIFPLISPSIYWACAKERVPVVQTLHNYRLLCLNSQLFRSVRSEPEGNVHSKICEKCTRKWFKYPGVRYGCYRDSKIGSLVVALMILFHNLIGTWKNKVDKYIALTEFQKQKMVEGGLPVAKITVKPNCIGNKVKHDLMTQTLNSNSEQYALCVGRLSPEKGIFTLLDAWKLIVKKTNDKNLMDKKKLMIAGSGPQKKELEAYAITLGIDSYVTFLGQQSRSEIADLMLSARFLIFPSLWYETFGLTVLEAGILGTPSIISSGITTSSIIEDGISGICFERGNAEDLAVKIRWAMSNPVECANIGRAASKKFSERFSSEVNEHLLILIYQEVIKKNDCNPIIK